MKLIQNEQPARKKIRSFLAIILLVLASSGVSACCQCKPAVASKGAVAAAIQRSGKPSAPITIQVTTSPESTNAVLTFMAAADDVVVSVRPVAGIDLSGNSLFRQQHLDAGQSMAVDLQHRLRAAQGDLSLLVEAQMNGRIQKKIFSIRVHGVTGTFQPQAEAPPEPATVDEKGRRLRVLPAK